MPFLRLAQVTILLICLTLFTQAGFADVTGLTNQVEQQTERISEQAGNLTEEEADLTAISNRLVKERSTGQSLEKELRQRHLALRENLSWLGDESEGEADRITRQRETLTADIDALKTAIDQVDRNLAETNRLISVISEIRHRNQFQRLLERNSLPISPSVWSIATEELGRVIQISSNDIRSWWQARLESAGLVRTLLTLLGGLAFGIIMIIPVRNWVHRRFVSRLSTFKPTPARKLRMAAFRIILKSLPALIGGFVIYQILSMSGAIPVTAQSFALSIWYGFIFIMLVDGASVAVFSPADPEWRILNINSSNARLVRMLLLTIAVVIALDNALSIAGQVLFGLPEALHSLRLAITSWILASLTLLLIRKPLWSAGKSEDGTVTYAANGGMLRVARFVMFVAATGAILVALFGYTDLAHFIQLQQYKIAILIVLIFAVRMILREAAQWTMSRFASSKHESTETITDPDSTTSEEPSLWLDLSIDTIVVLCAIPLLMLVIGFNALDLMTMGSRFADGFEIAGQRFSPVQIGIAILAFTLLMTLTRFVQRLMDKRIFSRTRLDIGVENSLKTLIGYVGLVIAFMTGVSMLGFDLSNLALVAGALSVGIGFGLQSIVNNFVSGLILLFERPIKVGDWVITNSGEGIVKKISVRSTEIETFDRSSILVPNSELISSSVTNWTHKNTLGRVTVPVGVAYKEDPERIMEILSGIPEMVDIVLNEPPAVIVFNGFGDSSLDFEIRAYIPDVSQSLKARTAIRVAIFKAFRDAEVEIPFPQRDLHLRDVDRSVGTMFNKKPEDD